MHAATTTNLHRLVMGRVAPVALLTLMLALVSGLWTAGDDIGDEMRAALSLGAAMALVSSQPGADDAALVGGLTRRLNEQTPRHVTLALHDSFGRQRLGALPPEPLSGVAALLFDAFSRLHPVERPAPVRLPLARPDGSTWTLTLAASPDNERREALAGLARFAAVVAAGAVAMLAVMTWNVRRALTPMAGLLAAIARIRGGDLRAAEDLPPTRVRELQAVREALRSLGAALEVAESDRRALSRKILTLQEDERAFIARELHDEFGQQLTATRIDATVLQHRLDGDAELAALVGGIGERMARMQLDVRSMLARLMPREAAEVGTLALPEMLAELAAGWRRRSGDGGIDVRVECSLGAAPAPLPAAMVLALYRMSQEALTNAARHAGAREFSLVVRVAGGAVEWQACDDGVGLPDVADALHRGSGLAGLRERAWAFGGDLQCVPARDDPQLPGLCLRSRLTIAPPEGKRA